jgi:amicyanin
MVYGAGGVKLGMAVLSRICCGERWKWASVRTVDAAPAATASVQILKDSYAPPSITIKAGDSVTWSNAYTTPGNGHTVTSSGRGPLKSPSLSQGGTFSYTFAAAGTYAYYCAIHPDMTGTVIVQ